MEDNILKLTENATISEGEYAAIEAEADARNDGKVCAEKIVIAGHATLTDVVEAATVEIGGDLTLVGILRADQIVIRGNVEVTGSIEAGEVIIDGNCNIHDTINVKKLTLKGNLILDAEIEVGEMSLSYELDGKGVIRADKMEVGGKIDFKGRIESGIFIAKAYHRGYINDLRSGQIEITHPFFLRHPTSILYRDYFTIENVECNAMYVESTGMSVVRGADVEFAKRCIVEEVFYLNNLVASDNCRLEHVEKIEDQTEDSIQE